MARKILIVLVVFAVVVAGYLVVRKIRRDRAARRAAELGTVLEEEIREWEARDRSRPPLFEPAVEGTAWEHYREACRVEEDCNDEAFDLEGFSEMHTALLEWDGPPFALDGKVEPYVAAFEPALVLVRKGTRTRFTGVLSDLRAGSITEPGEEETDEGSPHFLSTGLRDLLRARAALALRNVSPEEAVDWLLVAGRFAEDGIRASGGIDGWSWSMLQGQVLSDLAAMAGAGCLPGPRIERLEALPPPVVNGWSAVEGGWLKTQVDLMRIASGETGWLQNPFANKWYQEVFLSAVEPGPAAAYDVWVALREKFPKLTAEFPSGDDEALRQAAGRLRMEVRGWSTAWMFFGGGLAQSMEAEIHIRDLVWEAHEMLRLNVALSRYRERTGRDPETIAAIRPADVRETTSEGSWAWREHENAPHRWIGRGTPADLAKRERQMEKMARKVTEALLEDE